MPDTYFHRKLVKSKAERMALVIFPASHITNQCHKAWHASCGLSPRKRQ